MEEMQVAEIGSFCLNEACEDYQKVNHGNMMKHGKTDTGVQHHLCKTCKKSFTATKGTMFYRCRHTEEEIAECMSILRQQKRAVTLASQDSLQYLCSSVVWIF